MDDTKLLNNESRCPRCRGAQFIVGPQGGLAWNIKCITCEAKWWFCPPFGPVAIDNDDAVYTAAPVVLRDWISN